MHYYSFPWIYELFFKLPPLLIWRKRSLRALNKALREIQSYAPQKIIDIGCGAGVLTRLLRKTYPKAEILGIDYSKEMVDFNILKYGEIAKFKHANFLEYNGKHDLAVSFYSFCFFPLKQGIEKMEDIISPGGVGIIIICGKTPFSMIHRFFIKLIGEKLFLYSPDDLKNCFKKNFRVTSKIISDFEGSYIFMVKANG